MDQPFHYQPHSPPPQQPLIKLAPVLNLSSPPDNPDILGSDLNIVPNLNSTTRGVSSSLTNALKN